MTEPTADAVPVRASVIIPTRGGRDRLHHPLDALRRQSIEDFEVIVVVDGDVDDTAGLLETYRREGMTRLHSIVFPQNRGRSAALNAGFDAARGDILIRCDDDLEPGPDFVAEHVRAHDGRDGGVIGLTRNVFPDSAYARAYGRPAAEQHVSAALALPVSEHWRHWAANCSVTRAAHERVGGYDEDYRGYGWEDVDMGYRLRALGLPVRIDPALTVPHHGPALSTASRARRALHSGAARELFLAKHGQEALGPQRRPAGLWGAAVRGLAAVLTETRLERIAGGVDRILPRIPAGLGRKLVALCVEAAAHAAVDAAQTPEGRREAWAANATGVAAEHGLPLVHVSTDYVFDGARPIGQAYSPEDAVAPLGVYGQSKAAGEAAVAAVPRHHIVRTSWVIGEGRNFVRTMAALAERGVDPAVVGDQHGRPTFTEDLAAGILHLLERDAAPGIYHLSNEGPATTWAELAASVYELTGHDPSRVSATTTAEYFADKPDAAPRPANSLLDLSRIERTGFRPRDHREALAAYLAG